MNGDYVALAALGVLVLDRAAMWSLFWKRGWRVQAPARQKPPASRPDAQEPGAAGVTGPPSAAPVPSQISRRAASQ